MSENLTQAEIMLENETEKFMSEISKWTVNQKILDILKHSFRQGFVRGGQCVIDNILKGKYDEVN